MTAKLGQNIADAKQILIAEDVVAIPTETVYGLAGNALSLKAIARIYEVKDRPKFDPLIAHVPDIHAAEKLVTSFPKAAKILAEKFWPGPLTLLLEKKDTVPDLLTSGQPRVAIRVPNHPLSLQLLQELSFPLAAPSANPFGYVSPTTALHVADQLGHKISYILDGGKCEVGLESTIVGFHNQKITVYRLGGISIEDLEKTVGKVEVQVNTSSDPAAPGMLKSHYSPGKKLILGDISENLHTRKRQNVGVISFSEEFDVPKENLFILSKNSDFKEAAQNLFVALRSLDRPDISEILAEHFPENGLGRAINDRLRRASV
ncbi:MAG: L-threonylcarbamoyladenylate synthase [Bacteroidota bacterium]